MAALASMDLPKAARALALLLKNPDDLPQVFVIVDALSRPSLERLHRRMRRSMLGRALLEQRPQLTATLADHAALARLPEGSLGRAYLEFLEREGISAEGIVQASTEAGFLDRAETEVDFVGERLRDTHDLWHAVTGYHGDLIGELCLLTFTFAQTNNPALLFIVLGGMSKGFLRGHYDMVKHAYLRGRRAVWMVDVDWEPLLALPLDEVRARLGLDAPPRYEPRRTDMLRAEGKLAAAA